MIYLSRVPAPPLDDFVDYLWTIRDAPEHERERILPAGTLELVINLKDDTIRIYDSVHGEACTRFSGAVVSGAYAKSFVVDTREHASMIGVHFKPGGAFPFLGMPPSELASAHVDLGALWGNGAVELRERLCDLEDASAHFDVIERALLARLRCSVRRRGAVSFALDHLLRPGTAIREVAQRVGLSHRRLNEVFTAEVGMTPKLFARVQRFRRALVLAQRMKEPDWAALALACRYYDQSHLIRDFVTFAGLTPRDYLSRRSDQVKEHHLLV